MDPFREHPQTQETPGMSTTRVDDPTTQGRENNPPPCYEEVGRTTTRTRVTTAPGPATCGRSFDSVPGINTMTFTFSPRPGAAARWEQAWFAELFVKCGDVPRLMRDGFFWSADNVVPEEGYVTLCGADACGAACAGPPPAAPAGCWNVARHYVLRDLREPPLWTARMQVHAATHRTVSEFRVADLRPEHIETAAAWGAPGLVIYAYRCYAPESSFNAIYDDMPMKGWWPWPKKELVDGENA